MKDVVGALDTVKQGQVRRSRAWSSSPSERVLHLSYGGGKTATAKPLTKVELGGIFDRK